MRYVDFDAARAKWRFTADYRPTKRTIIGIEYNPLVGEVGPRGTWEALLETKDQAALHFGFSSDRIGTPRGYEAVFATVAKTIPGINLGVFASLHYSGFAKRFIYPFGASYQLDTKNGLMALYDGQHSNLILTHGEPSYYVSLMWVWLKHPGVSIGWGF
ncbi:MAG: hypothetical protein JSS66_10925 [Armatimonadetes bacterium]|nr:hypothetical protein [Armatimonadota bacterium]